jgi:hypothetical protein
MIQPLACALLSAAVLVAVPQGLKAKKWELPASLKKIQESYDAKKYGAALSELKTMAAELGKLRGAQLFDALPAVPNGWESPDQRAQDGDVTGFGMLGMSGTKRDYTRKGDDNVRMTITLMGDSPIVAGLAPLLSNPQLLGGEAEVVTFGAHKGMLKADKEEKSGSLQLVVGGAHMVNAEWHGLTRDELEPFLSEEAVKKMADALLN